MTEASYWMLYVAQNPDTPARTVDGSAIVITPHDSMLHTLNETATFIWDRADGSRTLSHIVEDLVGEFEVSLETARAEAEAFVQMAVEKGLMVASPSPEGGTPRRGATQARCGSGSSAHRRHARSRKDLEKFTRIRLPLWAGRVSVRQSWGRLDLSLSFSRSWPRRENSQRPRCSFPAGTSGFFGGVSSCSRRHP